MKVKEMIKKLQNFDQELEIIIEQDCELFRYAFCKDVYDGILYNSENDWMYEAEYYSENELNELKLINDFVVVVDVIDTIK